MNAYELRKIAHGSIDEERVERLFNKALASAMSCAKRGEFGTYMDLHENHTDPNHRTTAAEREEIIRRVRKEGFVVQKKHHGHRMSWD